MSKNTFIDLDAFMNTELSDFAAPEAEKITFWKPDPTKTQTKTYKAVVRLLPNPHAAMKLENCAIKQVKYWLDTPAGKGLFLCPSMIGEPSLIKDTWSRLSEGNAIEKDLAKKLSRKIKFYSLVLVIKDFVNEANNGKIFVFEYGPKIFDKIKSAMYPSKEDVEMGAIPANPFSIDKGRNFVISAKIVGGFANYDDSAFDSKVSAVSYDLKGTKTILNDQETKKKLAEDMSNAVDLNQFAFKPWTDEETMRAKKLLASLLGTSTTPAFVTPSENEKQVDSNEESNDEDLLEWANKNS